MSECPRQYTPENPTVAEARVARGGFEDDLRSLIVQFEEETGLSVRSIEIERDHAFDGSAILARVRAALMLD